MRAHTVVGGGGLELHVEETGDPAGKSVLSGWSYGAIIITDYVSCRGEDDIAGTNLVGAVSRLGKPLVTEGFFDEGFIALVPGLFSEDVGESTAALQQFIRLCAHEELSLEDWHSFIGITASVPPYVREALLTRNVDNDSVVARMRTPMLLSYGEVDWIVTPAVRNRLKELRADATLSVYPGVGHSPFWEAPERFNRELREFCESL